MENFSNIKFCIGPMSKNVVDSIIDYVNNKNIKMILIPSRRQVEHDGGYVNNWTTKEFCSYVRNKTNNIRGILMTFRNNKNNNLKNNKLIKIMKNNATILQIK